MARSVTFNGITRFRPGGITRINAEDLNQIGVTAGGVLGLIGEADGGAPGSESGLIALRDPALATSIFRDGPLVDAIKLAFQSSADPLVPGGAAQVVIYKTNASTKSKVHLPDLNSYLYATTASAGATTTLIPVNANISGVNALVDRWVIIQLMSLPGTPTFIRRVTANTAGAGTSSITVTPALPAAPVATDPVQVLATLIEVESRDYGQHTSDISVNVDYTLADESYQVVVDFEEQQQISPTLGGQLRNYLHVVYRGGPTAATTTVAAGSTSSVIQVSSALVAGAHAGQTVIISSGGNVKAITKVNSNTVSDITLDVALTFAPEIGDDIEIKSVTSAYGQFNGANGVAAQFATSITGVVGDDLAISIPAGLTVRQLAGLINANTNYLATIPSAINGDIEVAPQFDFGAGTVVSLQTSFSGTVATSGFRQDLKEIVAWINGSAQYVVASRYTVDAKDGGDGGTSDYPGTSGDSLPFAFQLYGGSRGISSNSDFQAGFDAMLLRVVDEVIPLIDQDLVNEGYSSNADWASVAAQLVDHVSAARGAACLERGGWIGFRGNKSQIIAAANSINDADVALVAQNPTIVGVSGSLVQKGPRELAVMGASMRLGAGEIGEPLTNKYLRTSAVSQDSSWNPSSVTDSGDFIQNGVMFAETVPGQGTKWVRDMTTWVRDDNLAFSEGSVRDIVRYVAYNLRKTIDARFTGRKATPATISAVKDTACTLLEVYRQQNIIVDSTDPATGQTIRAYYGLKVFSEGDIIRLNVGIFPVPGINFELIDIFLSLPTQSA